MMEFASRIDSVAAIGAHCDDILIGAGAMLMEMARSNPNLVVHALVLTGAGSEREPEEKNAFATFLPRTDVRLTVADLPDSRLPEHWGPVKQRLAAFRRECEPGLVLGPQRNDYHQDHRLIAELIPTEFRAHLVLGYEILKWESDLPNTSVYVPVSKEAAYRKARLLGQCYPSQAGRDWFDEESFLGLMRVRGVQSRAHYAEAFVLEKAVLDPFSARGRWRGSV
ncbi:PIG-L deacetylase family protein [Mycobacterium kubicae]|uniref:PIG-L deacetylase family protein n=1 Tax=Mycobacterium kubicae TaxID=120959 RepID=UPI0007FF462B|nr:PIG-L family deacetylase [Mycobacterium kubicae]OBF20436.1 GlcNAc-PI de-N-acetylase [Mycobacterium kubicae]OBK43228.1 GlcNAc-PI de-N-acetylase [Mycobacterium kubicae]QNI08347.1 PIG-L family deacetylase [Mycobacterium kubicae]